MNVGLKILWFPDKTEEELNVVIRSIGEKKENYETNIEITEATTILQQRDSNDPLVNFQQEAHNNRNLGNKQL
jgi:hypothetical protein